MGKYLIILLLVISAATLSAQGIIFAWGNNGNGQTNSPSGEDYTQLSAGSDFVIALRSNGSLVHWGSSANGINLVPSGTNFTAISAGFGHAIALRADGSIVGWGLNNEAQTNVPSGNNFVKIDAGAYHNIALRADGTLVAWGRNSSQQCNVPSGTYTDVAAGEVFSAAIRSNGTLAAWGTTWNGETSVPSGSNYVKISAQSRHGLALKTDGTLVGWGVNWNNQLNIPAGFTYTDMSAGWFHSLAVKTDGSLVGWGLDGNLQSSIPSGATGIPFASVSAGMHFSVALTAPVADADADGDGVPDDLDEYPDDSERAFDVVYPSPGGWGTLAYEDMWPKKGDYDFNDLVLDYQIILVMNSENHIKDVKANLELKAVGATFQNAFAVEFPFPVSTIASHSGLGNSQPYNMPLIEAGTHSILKVISNTNDFVSVPGHDVFWNTQPSQPSYDPIPISFEIILNTPLDPNDFPDWGVANPYLMVNRVQGHEVHLPGYPPTIHADTNLFGMDDDTTDPGSGRYYKTANNLPWALDIPVRWKYPIEKIQITRGYLAFAPWAESGGTQYENWYELISGQINSDNIYNP